MSADPGELTAAGAVTSSDSGRPADARRAAADEVELWWGSYSGWTMAPSFAVCILLTGVIVWAAWYFVGHGWEQLTALSAASVVWVVQLVRWGARFFGWNYRLTTRHLFALRGLRRPTIARLELARVARVHVHRNWVERQVHVGRVIVEGDGVMPLVLEGVYQPQRHADLIWDAVKRARENEPEA
jgi:hypothetical protein